MISQSFGPKLSLMSKKAVLRTAQDIFVLDKAFFLIEGHPSRTNDRGWEIKSARARRPISDKCESQPSLRAWPLEIKLSQTL